MTQKNTPPAITRLGIREVEQRIGAHRVTVWRWCRDGSFPAPEYLGERRTWRLDVIERWEAERLARPSSSRRRNGNLARRLSTPPTSGAASSA